MAALDDLMQGVDLGPMLAALDSFLAELGALDLTVEQVGTVFSLIQARLMSGLVELAK